VSRTTPGFDDSFRRHLIPERERAVLEVLATDLDPETTLGEIVDAAAHLGWSDTIGDLCLADLASALRGGAPAPRAAPVEARPHQPAPAPAPPAKASKPAAPPPTSRRTSHLAPPAARPLAKSAPLAKPAAPTKPSKAAPTSRRVAVPEDPDGEAMSIEQAAKLLLPMVRRLKQATMQELEESTGMGRRKLRFHIGQLVKNDRLARHGMGRGTYYTIKR
jgi:hypothetical protein